MKPVLTSHTRKRFQFGTVVCEDTLPVFDGAVIFGKDFIFDDTTGAPIFGHVTRIEHQTLTGFGLKVVHGVYTDIAASVEMLNDAFKGSAQPWYDPSLYFASTRDEQPPQSTLTLDTGDVLTRADLRQIFQGAITRTNDHVIFEDGVGNSFALLRTPRGQAA